MKVFVKHHFGAALLTELETGEKRTLLVQDSGDQLEILGEDWTDGTTEILDEYLQLFNKEQT